MRRCHKIKQPQTPFGANTLLWTLKCPERSEPLAEIDRACSERVELITNQLAKREGVTEALKAADQMEWVTRMNSIRARAEEIVLSELVYR